MEDMLENYVEKTENQNSPSPTGINRDLNAEWESFEKSIGLSLDGSETGGDRKAADRQSSGSRSMSMDSSPDRDTTGKFHDSGSSSSSSSKSASPEHSPEEPSVPPQEQVFPDVLVGIPEEPKPKEDRRRSHSRERRPSKPDETLKQNERQSSKSPKRKRSRSPRRRSRSRSPKRRRRSRSRERRSRSRERERRGRDRRRSRSTGRKRDSSPAPSRPSEETQRPASLKSRKSASTDDQSLISRDKRSVSSEKPSPDTSLEDVAKTTKDNKKDESFDTKSEDLRRKSVLDDEKEKTSVLSDKEESKSPQRKRSRSRDRKRSTSRDRKRSKSRDRKRRSSRERRRSRSRDRRRSRSRGRRSRSHERRRSSRDRIYSSSRRRSRSRDRGYYRRRSRSPDGGRRPQYSRDGRRDADLKAKKDSKFEMKRMDKCKRLGIETSSAQDVHKAIVNLQREQPSDLPLNFASSSEGQNQTVAAAMEEMHKKVVEMTGIQLPKYYNPAAVNPLKYAEQMQKRKLLWSGLKKKDEEAPPAGTQWQATMKLNDDKQSEKFRKLMGLKEDEKEKGQTDEGRLKQQEELFRGLDEQYEIARMSTHTHRGVGLGFSSQPPQYPR